MADENNTDQHAADEDDATGESFTRLAPLRLQLPVHQPVLDEARKLVGDWNTRVSDIAECVVQDPVLSLEIIRAANAMFYRQDRPSISAIRPAVVRLGVINLIDLVQDLSDRKNCVKRVAREHFHNLRLAAKDISDVAVALSHLVRPDLVSEARLTGMVSTLGHMLAVAFLGYKYLSLADECSGATLNYKLAKEFDFDVRRFRLAYLERHGFPQNLLFALDRDMSIPSPDLASFRFVIDSAIELVEAFDTDRWDKYLTKQNLPSYSNLRLLTLTDEQYESLHETVSTIRDHHLLQLALEGDAEISSGSYQNISIGDLLSDDELNNLLETRIQKTLAHEEQVVAEEQREKDINVFEMQDDFVIAFKAIAENIRSSERLLNQLLMTLTMDGPFNRAALVQIRNNECAEIRQAFGSGLKVGMTIPLGDDTSPFRSNEVIVRHDENDGGDSPFGIPSYALSPLDAENQEKLFIYADGGLQESLPIEAKRIFADLLKLTNRALPKLS